MVARDADFAVFDEDVRVGLGAADGKRGGRRGAQGRIDLDPGRGASGFRRTVRIDDADLGKALPEFFGHRRRQRFRADHEDAQVGQMGVVEVWIEQLLTHERRRRGPDSDTGVGQIPDEGVALGDGLAWAEHTGATQFQRAHPVEQ
ncbi:hypothetical protein G6F65_021308 [Rhizopus arrhizus]|nr:hypothetical protein G6F65_021308 [Rhizopus arrhizus]